MIVTITIYLLNRNRKNESTIKKYLKIMIITSVYVILGLYLIEKGSVHPHTPKQQIVVSFMLAKAS